jgi:amino acid adenylation domain-containing protein
VYVPFDPIYPQERLAFMLEDTRVTVLLTQERLVARFPIHTAQVVCLDSGWEAVGQESAENPISRVTADNLAYVIYTSGSTGKPKGVAVEHKQLLNRFAWMWRVYPFAAEEVCCLKTSVNFVDSLWELFGGLLQGGQTVIIHDRTLKDPQALVQTLAAHHVTRIMLVPSLLRLLLNTHDDLQGQLPRLKVWCTGGEALSVELCQRFLESMPHSILLNIYGLSEAFDVTYYDTRRWRGERMIIPIGRPIANMQLYLLDHHLEPVPIGIPGELYIGGIGLARGYLNRPELTAEKFIPHPFSNESGARLYKTGDLARYLPDGNIEYLGRIDQQVKLRGFRIEPGEIEAVLGQHPTVRQVVVLAWEDAPGDTRLVAYVVLRQESLPTSRALRSFLQQKLPDYMVPPAFVILDALPLTPSGKVDRRALPAPDQAQPHLEGAFIAPHTPWEVLLAEIWQEVLGVDHVGVYNNFFDLGGHSLLAMQVIARVEKRTGLRIYPRDLIFQTLGQLAAACEEHMPLPYLSKPMNFLQKIWHALQGRLHCGGDESCT